MLLAWGYVSELDKNICQSLSTGKSNTKVKTKLLVWYKSFLLGDKFHMKNNMSLGIYGRFNISNFKMGMIKYHDETNLASQVKTVKIGCFLTLKKTYFEFLTFLKERWFLTFFVSASCCTFLLSTLKSCYKKTSPIIKKKGSLHYIYL